MIRNKNPMSKRVLDIVLCVLALIVLFLVFALLAILVRAQLGSPILFRQTRPGLSSRPFILYKFRTMTNAKDQDGNLRPDEQRLTWLGRFLRRTSLDELPELFNVLKGDMSLVGPRPLLMQYLPYYSNREQLRHRMRPGITGWAQIHGRNYTPWDARLAMDVWYVENWSLALDFVILWKTIVQVIRSDGVAVDSNSVEADLDQERWGKRAMGMLDRDKQNCLRKE